MKLNAQSSRYFVQTPQQRQLGAWAMRNNNKNKIEYKKKPSNAIKWFLHSSSEWTDNIVCRMWLNFFKRYSLEEKRITYTLANFSGNQFLFHITTRNHCHAFHIPPFRFIFIAHSIVFHSNFPHVQSHSVYDS